MSSSSLSSSTAPPPIPGFHFDPQTGRYYSLDKAPADFLKRLAEERAHEQNKQSLKRFKASLVKRVVKVKINQYRSNHHHHSSPPFTATNSPPPPPRLHHLKPSTASTSFLDALFRRELGQLTHRDRHFLEPLSALCAARLPLHPEPSSQQHQQQLPRLSEAQIEQRLFYGRRSPRDQQLQSQCRGRPRLLYRSLPGSTHYCRENFSIAAQLQGAAPNYRGALCGDAFLFGPTLGFFNGRVDWYHYESLRVEVTVVQRGAGDRFQDHHRHRKCYWRLGRAPEMLSLVRPEQPIASANFTDFEEMGPALQHQHLVAAVVPGLIGPRTMVEEMGHNYRELFGLESFLNGGGGGVGGRVLDEEERMYAPARLAVSRSAVNHRFTSVHLLSIDPAAQNRRGHRPNGSNTAVRYCLNLLSEGEPELQYRRRRTVPAAIVGIGSTDPWHGRAYSNDLNLSLGEEEEEEEEEGDYLPVESWPWANRVGGRRRRAGGRLGGGSLVADRRGELRPSFPWGLVLVGEEEGNEAFGGLLRRLSYSACRREVEGAAGARSSRGCGLRGDAHLTSFDLQFLDCEWRSFKEVHSESLPSAVLSGFSDGRLQLAEWPRQAKLRSALQDPPDSATTCCRPNSVRTWRVPGLVPVRSVKFHPTRPTAVVVAADQGFLGLYDTRSLEEGVSFSDCQVVQPLILFEGHRSTTLPTPPSIDPFGADLVVAAGEDGLVRFWSSATGKMVNIFEPFPGADREEACSVRVAYSSCFKLLEQHFHTFGVDDDGRYVGEALMVVSNRFAQMHFAGVPDFFQTTE